MYDVKPWYQSRGVWGAVVAILATVAGVLGFDLAAEEQASLTELLLQMGAVIGAGVALWGRLAAQSRLG